MNSFIKQIVGPYEPSFLFALLFFAYLGALISLLIHATNRYKPSAKSPYHFSFIFLVKDNAARVLLNVILIAVSIRFFPEITGKEVGMWGALGMGMSYDKILELLRNLCVIDKGGTTKPDDKRDIGVYN